MKEAQCRKCRKTRQKLFLRGERCFLPKCAMIKKPYSPGIHKRKGGPSSEYGIQLLEKQKIRHTYGIRERQFKRYFREASREKGVVGDNLIGKLETRLDNIVFRLKWAESRKQARQLVSHGHILINGKRVNLPSFGVELKDIVKIKPASLNLALFKDLRTKLKGYKPPSWLSFDKDKLEGKILSLPKQEDVNPPADLQMIVEFYSR